MEVDMAVEDVITAYRENAPRVARVGTHTVAPQTIRIWIRDYDSPSGKRLLYNSDSSAPAWERKSIGCANTTKNRAILRAAGVPV